MGVEKLGMGLTFTGFMAPHPQFIFVLIIFTTFMVNASIQPLIH